MNSPHDVVTVTIDNRPLTAAKGSTILEAARAADVYIPTLCAHKDLTPYGGCRMCIVEVEGMRGFPTACTTPVEHGMVVRTHTAQLHEIRTEILRLILSEHPASCLVCDEQEECRKYSATIRKSGVTTGCRYCPNDGQCELEQVVRHLNITEIGYPIYYRNLPVHKEDPFFDRDYNLCILCGRCVRMCQEIRMAGTLTFVRRGPDTVVGPAFDRSHYDAGCEFCGACVSVCPTGALSEKARKWKGAAEREVTTTCAFCGVGCQLRLQVKDREVIGALPAEDELVNRGQLCVKGRFCIPEIVSHPRRLRRAYKLRDGVLVDIGWDEAVNIAAERLKDCAPDEFGMLVSPNCANEDLYAAQKFARAALDSNNVDTPARATYGPSYRPYLEFLKQPAALEDLRQADVIVSLGLDTRFGRSVVGAELRKAYRRGAGIVTVHHRRHDLAQIAAHWIQPDMGAWNFPVQRLIALSTGATKARLKDNGSGVGAEVEGASRLIRQAARPVILLGPAFIMGVDGPEMLAAVRAWAEKTGAKVMPLPSYNNLVGAILMGATGDLLPGGVSLHNESQRGRLSTAWGKLVPSREPTWNSTSVTGKEKLKVLYIVGEVLSDPRQAADFIIFQNIFSPRRTEDADLILPSAAFSEVDGTVINGEGRMQRVRRAVDPPEDALPDWAILCRIARALGADGFDFAAPKEIHAEFSSLIEGLAEFQAPSRAAHHWNLDLPAGAERKVPRGSNGSAKHPYVLTSTSLEHTYRGFAMADRVVGLRRLYPTGILEINPDDAGKIGVAEGEAVVVSCDGLEIVSAAAITKEQPEGSVHALLSAGERCGASPRRVQVRKQHVPST